MAEQFVGMVIGYLITAFIFGYLGSAIGRNKNADSVGFWLGFILGPLGLIITLFVDNRPRGAEHPPAAVVRHEPSIETFSCKSCHEPIVWSSESTGSKIVCGECGTINAISKLRKCPDCDKDISRRVSSCPHCGCPA